MSLARLLSMGGDNGSTITIGHNAELGMSGYISPLIAPAWGVAPHGSVSNDITPFGTLAWLESESDAAIYVARPIGEPQPALSTLRVNGIDHSMVFDYSVDFSGLTYWYFYEPGGSMVGTLSVGATYPWSLS